MNYRPLFARDLFADLDRLQRDALQAFDRQPAIRGTGRGYPALNIGVTPRSLELFVFAPGLDPATLDVQVEKGVLTVAGERKAEAPAEKSTRHIDERFAGRFRRVVTLPDDADPEGVEAKYRDGVVHLTIARKQAAQPRRITVQ
jgi:HSP20 family protein